MLMFIYVVVLVVLSFGKKRLTGYEVQLGSLAIDTSFRGVALREESLYTAQSGGYINFYAREDAKVNKGALIYSIDKSGTFSELIEANEADSGSLTEEDLSELKTEIKNYAAYFDDRDFSTLYDFEYSVFGTASKLINSNTMKTISELSEDNLMSDSVELAYAPNSGIVVYSYDGYENLVPSSVSMNIFDNTTYTKKQIASNSLIAETDYAYKLVTSEDWSIVAPLSEEQAAAFAETEIVRVKFLKNGYTSRANCKVIENGDGKYIELDLRDSMITFATERFVDVEITTEEEAGLKIPNSSVVDMEFYLIPEKFLTQGSSGSGFMKRTYGEDSSVTVEFVPASVYQNQDGMLYVSTEQFNPGDILVAPDSEETYTVSQKDRLTGVYNINKGYADFTKIDTREQNEEYTIVSDNAPYGLRVFDRIVLDASSVKENDLVVSD